MEEISDQALLEEIVETRFTFPRPAVKAHGWETLTLFRLSRGELRTCSAGKPAGVNEEVGVFGGGDTVQDREPPRINRRQRGLSVPGEPVASEPVETAEGLARSGGGG